MSRATIIQTYENQTAVLEYTDTFLLLNSECRLSIDFKQSNVINKENILNSWKFILVFTDNLIDDKKPMSAYVTSEDDGKTFIISHYKWYGDEVENVAPHIINVKGRNEKLLILISSSALESNKNRRSVKITVWRQN